MNQHLHPDIVRNIEEQQKRGGVQLDKLAVGTKVEAQTLNTLYKIEVLRNGKQRIEGGKYFPQAVETRISGSTWGGSMLALKWLGLGMNMEIHKGVPSDRPIFTTSPVQSLKIIAPDGSWEYSLSV
ncbi:MAG: hypothetical protein MN733_43225 [Nitrososphaera sp.]|nr:hypothetical protein [Nitrososphaera sp.]